MAVHDIVLLLSLALRRLDHNPSHLVSHQKALQILVGAPVLNVFLGHLMCAISCYCPEIRLLILGIYDMDKVVSGLQSALRFFVFFLIDAIIQRPRSLNLRSGCLLLDVSHWQ